MEPISLENRLSILPDEFKLKNLIGAVTTFENIRLCRFMEERMQNTKKANDLVRKMKTVKAVIPA